MAASDTSAVSPIPLSVLIRTLNEADRIAATIASARALGGELVVIDAGSKDDTVKICEAHGARVVHNAWPGFGPQRHFGEEQCRFDHIFSLDADEVLTPAMVAEIRAQFLPGPAPRLMNIRKAVVFPYRKRPPPFGFCHEQILIYDRRIARTGNNPNWDKLEIAAPDKPVTIREPLWHHSFRDWHHMIAKANYVAKLAAETQKPKSRTELVLRLFFEFPLTFLKFYVLRRYCLGGIDGFTMAFLTAFGRWARIAQMLEKHDHPPMERH